MCVYTDSFISDFSLDRREPHTVSNIFSFFGNSFSIVCSRKIVHIEQRTLFNRSECFEPRALEMSGILKVLKGLLERLRFDIFSSLFSSKSSVYQFSFNYNAFLFSFLFYHRVVLWYATCFSSELFILKLASDKEAKLWVGRGDATLSSCTTASFSLQHFLVTHS